MYCGNCFRDNALVAQLRQMGHHALMVPLYLPLTLDEADQSEGTPLFFSGLNVYLAQKFNCFKKAPNWLRRMLTAEWLLNWLGNFAGKTRGADVGDLTLSMMRGESGHQARELEQLIAWLKEHEQPDVVCLSNALIVGLAKRLRAELGVPVVCLLEGEDAFLDSLPSPQREDTWAELRERIADIDLFIAPTRYYADTMAQRAGIPADKLEHIHNGINLDQPRRLRAKRPAGRPAGARLLRPHVPGEGTRHARRCVHPPEANRPSAGTQAGGRRRLPAV